MNRVLVSPNRLQIKTMRSISIDCLDLDVKNMPGQQKLRKKGHTDFYKKLRESYFIFSMCSYGNPSKAYFATKQCRIVSKWCQTNAEIVSNSVEIVSEQCRIVSKQCRNSVKQYRIVSNSVEQCRIVSEQCRIVSKQCRNSVEQCRIVSHSIKV